MKLDDIWLLPPGYCLQRLEENGPYRGFLVGGVFKDACRNGLWTHRDLEKRYWAVTKAYAPGKLAKRNLLLEMWMHYKFVPEFTGEDNVGRTK